MMVVIVVMVMIVVMVVIMMVVVIVVMICSHKAAHAGAEGITKRTISHVRTGRIRTLSFHMVVVAFLYGTDLAFEAQNRRAVLAQHASGRWHGAKGRVRTVLGADLVGFAFFQSQHLTAIAADAAVWRRRCTDLFHDAFSESFQHLGVITQVARFDELDARVFCCDLISETVNPVDQDARE